MEQERDRTDEDSLPALVAVARDAFIFCDRYFSHHTVPHAIGRADKDLLDQFGRAAGIEECGWTRIFGLAINCAWWGMAKRLCEVVDIVERLPRVGLALAMLTRSIQEHFVNLVLLLNLEGTELSALLAGYLRENWRDLNKDVAFCGALDPNYRTREEDFASSERMEQASQRLEKTHPVREGYERLKSMSSADPIAPCKINRACEILSSRGGCEENLLKALHNSIFTDYSGDVHFRLTGLQPRDLGNKMLLAPYSTLRREAVFESVVCFFVGLEELDRFHGGKHKDEIARLSKRVVQAKESQVSRDVRPFQGRE